MNNPVIYIFLNKSLHMTVGKAAAQAVHATMMANTHPNMINDESRKAWKDATHKTVIVLESRDEAHMKNTVEYLVERGINVYYVIDEGVNEIDPHTTTAMATPILEKDDEKTIKAMSTFKLYREVARFTMEFER